MLCRKDCRLHRTPDLRREGCPGEVKAKKQLFCLGPTRLKRQLEDCTVAVSASFHECAVKIAQRINDETSLWISPVQTREVEATQNFFLPATSRFRAQLKNCAKVVSPSGDGRSVQVSETIKDQPTIRSPAVSASAEAV